jgi:SAM-dependent methyltransferase
VGSNQLESHLERQIECSRHFFWHRLRWRAVASILPADRRFELIDVGAGAGILSSFLAADRPLAEYRFVEPIDSLQRRLETEHGASSNAIDEATYPNADYLTLLDVLEHQTDDRKFVQELLGRMKPGATLVLTVPALPALWSGWDVALGHHQRYTKRSLRESIRGLPCELVEISYLFPELVAPALARKWLRRDQSVSAEDETFFPDLPRPVDQSLFLLGSASLALRRVWPFGTSLLAVIRRS